MTGWKIVPHDVRPELYPSPEDGIPAHLRLGLDAANKKRMDM
jgi:hypothetical protein